VIRDEKLQIIALQEVRSEWEFGSIKKNLPLGWTGHYEFDTLAPGNHGRYGFAFLWNAIEINECSKSDPVLFRNNADPKLSRDPKYGRFISVLNPLCEYRLIDIHLNSSDPTQKRHEWSFIGKKIYNRIQVDRTNSNFEGAYTFILGDFNYSVSECKQYAALDGFANINTIMEELTHINTSAIDGKCYYNSSLDHFAYDIKKCSSIVSGAWRVNAVKKYFKNDFELYMKKVSDHVPIVIEIY
jgi:endonuclease/exonuclease/phosphatase family metal-dependent hydrolase